MKSKILNLQFSIPFFLFLCVLILGSSAQNNNSKTFSGCSPSTAHTDLDIGNVRATILINGDMWWDLIGNPLYFVPKNSGLSPLFAGALWFGGTDDAGQLKVAAQTYRQSGPDFWPGPIDTITQDVSPATCLAFDRHWKITRQEVADFIGGSAPTQAIIDWPGNGNGTSSNFLAPYVDVNADGIYNYLDGDYPAYDFGTLTNLSMYDKLSGDQTLFWIFNDLGNIHSETNSQYPIGLEVHAQAYAFCTSDSDLTNTTFYNYKFFNRSSLRLNHTALGVWTDPDLGYYLDDYVGCDVERNFGFAYNGDNFDDTPSGYGSDLAAIGIDLLKGPLADAIDGIDNDHDSLIDELDEQILMTGFLYYNNDGSNVGNPSTAQQYYNYLTGFWRDNSPLVFGGYGYQTPGAINAAYMFPGTSDPNAYGTSGQQQSFIWTEEEPLGPGSSPNTPGDRRFLMSSKEFTLQTGEFRTFSTAAIFARSSGGIVPSITALKAADDRIQSFFDSGFTNITTCTVSIGIDEMAENLSLTLFPNPSSAFIRATIPDGVNKNYLIHIFAADGKEVKMLETRNQSEISVSVADWVPGIYYYSIKSHKGQVIGGKFLVIH